MIQPYAAVVQSMWSSGLDLLTIIPPPAMVHLVGLPKAVADAYADKPALHLHYKQSDAGNLNLQFQADGLYGTLSFTVGVLDVLVPWFAIDKILGVEPESLDILIDLRPLGAEKPAPQEEFEGNIVSLAARRRR